jgi:signal peptidase II
MQDRPERKAAAADRILGAQRPMEERPPMEDRQSLPDHSKSLPPERGPLPEGPEQSPPAARTVEGPVAVEPALQAGSRRWNYFVAGGVFVLLMAGGLSLDLVTKSYVFQQYWPYNQDPNDWPNNHEPHWWIDGILGIQTSTNGGALFGMMQGYRVIFVTLSLAALVGLLLWLFCLGGWKDPWLLICLGLITGGILGNLYDRLGLWHDRHTPVDFHYHVRDWIHFRLQGVPLFDPWPNFNIADSLLVVGVACMLIHNLFFAPPQEA